MLLTGFGNLLLNLLCSCLDWQIGLYVSTKLNHRLAFKLVDLQTTVVPGFRVLGFSALPGFRALKAGDGESSVGT